MSFHDLPFPPCRKSKSLRQITTLAGGLERVEELALVRAFQFTYALALDTGLVLCPY